MDLETRKHMWEIYMYRGCYLPDAILRETCVSMRFKYIRVLEQRFVEGERSWREKISFPLCCSLLKASIIVFWILEIGINQYLEYLFEDRFNSIWNERIEETWFTNAYERVSRNSDDSISRNLISSKNIENIYLFDTVVNNSNKFLGIRSVRIFRMLFSQNDSILNLKMVKSLLNHKRVGGVYFSLKFKQLVFVNFSPLVRLIYFLLKVHLIRY